VKAENPREIAVRVLRKRGGDGDYTEGLLEKELAAAGLSSADRALCQELVYGLVRWQAPLDWLVGRKTGNRTQNATLRLLLHLGLYQLFWLQRIPNHAAVHETVELGKRLGFGPQAGFLNAVLRGYAREREATVRELEDLKKNDPALGYSHPAWLVERWQARWGADNTARLLEWNNTPPSLYARLNLLKTDAARLTAAWQNEGVKFIGRAWDWTGPDSVFELLSHPPLGQSESFKNGWFYIQDPSTLLAVSELNARPNETILDLCAAPGGKTAYIAQQMQNRGRIVASDNQPGRLELVRENCVRLGVTCVEYSQPAAGMLFDRILVDAPCSNTGVLRRRVDLRWRINSAELTRLRKTQLALLEQSAGLLKSGGTLVYSTCSFEQEENESVTQEFLKAHRDYALEQQRQLLPFVEGVDGAYVARIRKSG
jgi:16S rRNA (cytosine967-C5)-methyltransferase